MIIYGVSIWFKPNVKLLTKIPQLQRQSLLTITKCYSTVSHDALSVLAGYLPIDLVLGKELEFHKDIKDVETNNTQINLNKKNNVYRINCPSLEIRYRNKLDRRSDKEIYTDGSKINDKVGSAIVVYNYRNKIYQDSYRLNDEATVYMAELLAIEKAIDYVISKRDYKNNKYVIISDSLSVLQSIVSLKENRNYITKLRNKINYLGINLYRTKGHVGHPGNDTAKKATTRENANITFHMTRYQ